MQHREIEREKTKRFYTYPSNTQSYSNVVERLQRRATNTHRCSDVDAITSKLKRCFNVVSTFSSKFHSMCTINVVLLTFVTLKLRSQISNCFTTLTLRLQVYKVFTTLPQHCNSKCKLSWML